MPTPAATEPSKSPADSKPDVGVSWYGELFADIDKLPVDAEIRTRWLVRQCHARLQPAVIMIAGEIQGETIRQSDSNSLVSRSVVAELRQDLMEGLSEQVEKGPNAKAQLRRIDGRK